MRLRSMLVLLLAGIVAIPSFASPVPKKEAAQTKAGLYVDAKESFDMLSNPNGRHVVLIDVRDPAELMYTGYAPRMDAHVPLSIIDSTGYDSEHETYGVKRNQDFVDDMLNTFEGLKVTKKSHIIFMCRSGSTRSSAAADIMLAEGYPNVYTMTDGFEGGKAKTGPQKGARTVDGWKNSGLPWSFKLQEEKLYMTME